LKNLEVELIQLNKNEEALNKNHQELIELHHVLNETSNFFSEVFFFFFFFAETKVIVISNKLKTESGQSYGVTVQQIRDDASSLYEDDQELPVIEQQDPNRSVRLK